MLPVFAAIRQAKPRSGINAVAVDRRDLQNINIGLWWLNSLAPAIEIRYRRLITAPQLRAARALLGLDQRALAAACGLSLPTIQRMEASESMVRGNVESLMKLIEALERAGIELINEGAASGSGGRGVRLKRTARPRGRRSAGA